MNRQLCFTVCVILLAIFSNSIFAGTYSGGSGEPNDPYQIADVNDLLALAADTNDYNKCFILTADVNLQGQVFTTAIIAADTSSDDYFQGTPFTGMFDGNGHKITHFTINGGSNSFLGLFGYIGTGGSVKNFGLENFEVSGGDYVGGLVGYNRGSINNCCSTSTVSGGTYIGGLVGSNGSGSSISNCHATSKVESFCGGDYWACVGGLVGENSGSISNCYSTGTVDSCWSGRWNVGGLIGQNYSSGSITQCHSTSAVSGNSNNIGGLIGQNYGGIITSCYATGTVIGTGSCNVGGLIGYHGGQIIISNCYSTGAVSSSGSSLGGLIGQSYGGNYINCYSTGGVGGSSKVGGLVGRGEYISVTNCYSIGSISGGDFVGGLVGLNESSMVTNSFWDTQTSGQTTSAGGEGKTTAEMKQINTFANWDFVETWGIEDNQTYPFLRLTYPVGDLDLDKKVDLIDFAIFANHWLEENR